MYSVSLFNNGIETIIHYPSAEKGIPHLLNLDLKESLSQAEQLSFIMSYNNVGYNLINGLKTKVKVIDTRDNTVVFSGRVIPLKSNMSNGKFEKEVTCEGALSYLKDTNTRRWNFKNQTPTQILTYLLNEHNSKVDSSRQIQLGTIQVTQPITIDTNYESTLNAVITKLRNILGGDIRVREINNILYLDYLLAQGKNNEVEIKLGYNLKDMAVEYDPLDITTRVIPLGYGEGINQLDIKKVNGNLEYIQDAIAVAEYGVIEGVATNKDIQNADTLKVYGENVLNEKKQIKLVYTSSQLDLSVLSGHENEKYSLGDTLHTLCDVMSVDVYARVITRDRDLINSPWNPTLTISTRPISLSDQIIDLKQRNLSLENAPQGNTCIFSLNQSENADITHPIIFDLDIPEEAININKVYINLHGRKYRSYEKGVAAGGSSTATSLGGGDHKHKMLRYEPFGIITDTIASFLAGDANQGVGFTVMMRTDVTQDLYTAGSSGEHEHDVEIPEHSHEIESAIFESTYPKNTKVKVNGIDISVNFGDGESAFDEYNLDITSKINIGNNKVEISTIQNGRIEAIIYAQIFIQSK